MLKQFKQYLLIFRTNRILFMSVFIISIVSAILYRQFRADNFSAKFIFAPYFQTSADLGIKLDILEDLIENDNFAQAKSFLKTKYDFSVIQSFKTEITKKNGDCSNKHHKIDISVHISDTNCLYILDKSMQSYINEFILDSSMKYRGIEVTKETLSLCDDYVLNKDSILDEIANNYIDEYSNEGLIISNDLAVKFAQARTFAELKSDLTVNYISSFSKSVLRVKETYSFLAFIFLAGIVPVSILMLFINLLFYSE